MHVREQIMSAVVAAITGLPTTGARVLYDAAYAITDLPALAVMWSEDDTEDVDGGLGDGPVATRALKFNVTGRAKIGDGVPSVLGTIAAEVEIAVMTSAAVAALVHLIEYTSSTIAVSTELEQPAGEVSVGFSALYRVKIDDPETVIS